MAGRRARSLSLGFGRFGRSKRDVVSDSAEGSGFPGEGADRPKDNPFAAYGASVDRTPKGSRTRQSVERRATVSESSTRGTHQPPPPPPPPRGSRPAPKKSSQRSKRQTKSTRRRRVVEEVPSYIEHKMDDSQDTSSSTMIARDSGDTNKDRELFRTGKIRIICSEDGCHFHIPLEIGRMSGKIKRELIQSRNKQREFEFKSIKKSSIKKVIKFMIYHWNNPMSDLKYPLESCNLHSLVSNFDADFIDTIHYETLFELMNAAEEFELPSLIQLCSAKYASMIKASLMNGTGIAEQFDLTDDDLLSESEEQQILTRFSHLTIT